MKLKTFLGTLLTVSISFGAGALAALIVAPDLLRNLGGSDLPEALTARLEAVGDLEGISSIHKANGRVQLLDGNGVKVLRLVGIDMTAGPDLELLLLETGDVAGSRDIRSADAVSLGSLRSAEGDQVYLVPDGLDTAGFRSVAIWSASARTLFAIAPLERDTDGGTSQVSDG